MNIVDSEVKFNHFLELLPRFKIIGLDTEFQRTKTYYPLLSLIQVALDEKNIFLLDVLVLKDELIKKFLQHLLDKKTEVIIHSCEQDILAIFYKYKIILQNVFDTQIYAKEIFEHDIGYGNLCKEFLNIDVDKNCQYSDWLKRPLTSEMLDYAAIDVLHLHALRDILLKKIQISEKLKQKLKHLEEESRYVLNPLAGWKTFEKKTKKTQKHFLNVIKEMYQKREIIAEKNNIIRKYVIRDEILIAIAEKKFYNMEMKNLRISKYAKTEDFIV